MVQFNSTKEEKNLIFKIAKRAFKERVGSGGMLDMIMALNATHSNGTPLDFEKLLGFDSLNFAHDINGIVNHLDRLTGKLTGGFLPRCSKH